MRPFSPKRTGETERCQQRESVARFALLLVPDRLIDRDLVAFGEAGSAADLARIRLGFAGLADFGLFGSFDA